MDRKGARLSRNRVLGIVFRYLLSLILSLDSLFIFYFVLTPLTVYFSYFLLSIFYQVMMQGSALLINDSVILLNEACIAGSAYFLLALLNLTTPGIKTVQRMRIFLFGASILFAFNLLRILVFSALFVNGFALFDLLHLFVWNVLSVLVVVMIWLISVNRFRLKGIPVISDLIYLRSFIRKR